MKILYDIIIYVFMTQELFVPLMFMLQTECYLVPKLTQYIRQTLADLNVKQCRVVRQNR